jgi:hypothetical protein
MELKTFAETTAPGVQVTVCCPMVRTDDAQANAKLLRTKNRLVKSAQDGLLKIITNDNITEKHLSSKGLHLSPSGTRQLAVNMIAYMQSLKD